MEPLTAWSWMGIIVSRCFKETGCGCGHHLLIKKNQDKMDINSGIVAQLALFTRKLGQVGEWDFI